MHTHVDTVQLLVVVVAPSVRKRSTLAAQNQSIWKEAEEDRFR